MILPDEVKHNIMATTIKYNTERLLEARSTDKGNFPEKRHLVPLASGDQLYSVPLPLGKVG